jgi:hypothetical protein
LQEIQWRFAPFGGQPEYHLLNPGRRQGLAYVCVSNDPGRKIQLSEGTRYG